MKPDPSKKTAKAIVGKKSVDNADQCRRVAGVVQLTDSESAAPAAGTKITETLQFRGTASSGSSFRIHTVLLLSSPTCRTTDQTLRLPAPSPVTRSMRQFLNACDHKSCTTVSDLARSECARRRQCEAMSPFSLRNARNGRYGNYKSGLQIA